jgi:protein transport protein SEC61 subunit gamma and related proteins
MADGKSETDVLATMLVKPLRQFTVNSYRFLVSCERPSSKELYQIVVTTGMGFILMGLIGFLVKLVHFPIKQILLS